MPVTASAERMRSRLIVSEDSTARYETSSPDGAGGVMATTSALVFPAACRPPASQGRRETIIGRSSSLTASVSHQGSALTPTSPLMASAGTGSTPMDALPSRTPRSTPLSVRAVISGVSAPK